MPPLLSVFCAWIASLLRSRTSLCLENLALRYQLAVYKQTLARPRLHPTDRLFWVWLSRLWPGWQDALAFVQPRTVIAWQKKRFRDYWRRLSQQGQLGRPVISKEMRALIRTCGTRIRLRGHLALSGHSRSSALPWPNPPWRSIAQGLVSRPRQPGEPS